MSEFTGKDGWMAFIKIQRDKHYNPNATAKEVMESNRNENRMWKEYGKPLDYYAHEYTADSQIACRYCDKPLAYWHGSPDLSACDVVCFECFRERTEKENIKK